MVFLELHTGRYRVSIEGRGPLSEFPIWFCEVLESLSSRVPTGV